MTDLLADWWQHTITIARYTGSGVTGDTYDDPTTETCFIDDRRKLVVTASGSDAMSTAAVFLPSTVDDVPLDSLVTLPSNFGGRVARVILVSRHDAGALDTPNHVEMALL